MIFDWDRTSDDDLLGETVIPIATLPADGSRQGYDNLPLQGPRATGTLSVSMTLRPYQAGDISLDPPRTLGFLQTKLVRVEGLHPDCHPFARLHFGEHIWITPPAPEHAPEDPAIFTDADVDLVITESNDGYTVRIDLWDQSHRGVFLGSAYVAVASVLNVEMQELVVDLKERVQTDADLDPSPTLAPHGTVAHAAPKVPVTGRAVLQFQYTPKAVLLERFWLTLGQKFDLDSSGGLDANEFAMLMAGIGSDLSSEECDQVFAAADTNSNGQVTFLELSQHMSAVRQGHMSPLRRSPFSGRSLLGHTDDEIFAALNREMAVLAAHGEDAQSCAEAFLLARTYVNKATENAPPTDKVIIVQDRATGMMLKEHIPTYIALALRGLYRTAIGRGAAHADKTKRMLASSTRKAGVTKSHPKSRKDIPGFIRQYNIKMDEALQPNPEMYTHFNDFFCRKLRPGARPIDAVDDPSQLCSPADSRMNAFSTVPLSQHFWIKGDHFTVDAVCGRNHHLTDLLADGPLIIARLAPQDYHRIHFPVAATILSATDIDGTYYTVSPMAVCKNIDVYTENRRKVLHCTSPVLGEFVMVMVGATMVGSCVLTAEIGRAYDKGDEVGYFAFGGSTTLLLFPPGVVQLDADLCENSKKPVETLVRMGNHIGCAGPRSPWAAAHASAAPPAPAAPASAPVPAPMPASVSVTEAPALPIMASPQPAN